MYIRGPLIEKKGLTSISRNYRNTNIYSNRITSLNIKIPLTSVGKSWIGLFGVNKVYSESYSMI